MFNNNMLNDKSWKKVFFFNITDYTERGETGNNWY